MNQSTTLLSTEKLNMQYILNPCYIMRSDVNRIILTTTGSQEFDNINQINTMTFIHPIHAMMLSFFKGDKSLKEILFEISYFFEISSESANDLINKFVENEKNVVIEYDNNFFYFPPMILIEYKSEYALRSFSVNDFNLKGTLDFETSRLNVPIEASFLINNKCMTNCVYCYADKRHIYDCTIPLDRIKQIINETKKLGFRNIDIQGGELFLYEHWYELLKELFEAKYSVYISTKCSLSSSQINQLKELGVKEIQISLDSIFADDLKLNLRVNDNYCSNIIKTIKLLNKKGFTIKLKPVITSLTFNIKRIEQYIDYFKQFENVKIIELTAAAFSDYKTHEEFLSYRLSLENIQEIKDLVSRKKAECHFNLHADVSVENAIRDQPFDIKKSNFDKRARCTGNQSSFLILPNGDVTLCEKAYFNKNLIIGNILENSIMDVWNSDRAKNFFYIPQTAFPEDSYCSRCAEFAECRYNLGICWVDVMAAYGEENWLYPVPDCPYSPPPKQITYCE